MQVQSMYFKRRAAQALGDEILQANLAKFGTAGLAQLRAQAVQA